ncbi:MAG: hypothetical protein LBD53_02715 [Tannerella sp.]|jgi:uncharacterized membrane protein|nr:hypothetical protein [Tannerella sp.]
MSIRELLIKSKITTVLWSIVLSCSALTAFASASLYTPYTHVAVAPGQSVDYTIDLINRSGATSNDAISVTGFPQGWRYTLISGAYTAKSIAVLNGEKKTLTLKVEVPYQVEKNTYKFYVRAGSSVLELAIDVTEKGSNESEFSTAQPNMQGNANSTFTYRASLKNRTAQKQLYAMMSDAPRGWSVTFNVEGRSVTSVEMEANTSKDIQIDLKPSSQIGAGSYKVPLRAVTGATSAALELEAVVTGSYEMQFSTPTGLVSDKLNAGGKRQIQVVVRNTGSSDLTAIQLKSQAPAKWEVTYDPTQIDKLAPGAEATAYATIRSDRRAIPGDYIVNLDASTPETSSKIALRITVKTSAIWGWLGFLIIVAALAGVVYLFRKYGRR